MYYESEQWPHIKRYEGHIYIHYGEPGSPWEESFLVRYSFYEKMAEILEWDDVAEHYSSSLPYDRPQYEIERVLADANERASTAATNFKGILRAIFSDESLESRAKRLAPC